MASFEWNISNLVGHIEKYFPVNAISCVVTDFNPGLNPPVLAGTIRIVQ